VAPLWNALYAVGADVVLNGHDHLYERFAQEDASGNPTTAGIREFVVGTGGESPNGLEANPPSTLEANDSSFGVLVLTLHSSTYTWRFVTTGGATTDSGTAACHGPGAGAAAVRAARRADTTGGARLSGRPLLFEVLTPVTTSLPSVKRRGLAVPVLASRAVDVAVTAWVRANGGSRRIATFHETESQITRPHSLIRLRFPARSLQHVKAATLTLSFAAEDGAGHRRSVTRTLRLR
jgi:hypothetical protein